MTKKARNDVLVGKTRRTKTGCGNLYVTINFENDQPVEVFVRLGKAGGCASSQTEALGRLISLALKNGVAMDEIIKQLMGIGCHLPTFIGEGNKNLSCADAVASTLRVLCKLDMPKLETLKASFSNTPCPDCGTALMFGEGCVKCMSCGYTKC